MASVASIEFFDGLAAKAGAVRRNRLKADQIPRVRESSLKRPLFFDEHFLMRVGGAAGVQDDPEDRGDDCAHDDEEEFVHACLWKRFASFHVQWLLTW